MIVTPKKKLREWIGIYGSLMLIRVPNWLFVASTKNYDMKLFFLQFFFTLSTFFLLNFFFTLSNFFLRERIGIYGSLMSIRVPNWLFVASTKNYDLKLFFCNFFLLYPIFFC